MALPQTPLSQEDDHVRGDIQKIAVLFTDIVGSTRYFKDQGDLAGRKMLQDHQEIASRPIVEHGGLVVKTLGDSVMAYFSDPKEAVKAAVRIQQKLHRNNTTRKADKQFHVRIGIHWGDGIVEEKDIFGDVVNMAAKIVPLADGGQILISEETYSQVRALSPVKYEIFDIQNEKEEYKDLKVYSALWDDTIRFDPTASNLLYLRPLWNLGDQDFEKAWNHFLNNRKSLYGNKILEEKVLSNKSVALVVTNVQQAIDIAFKALGYLKKRMEGNDTFKFLPMEIIIDSGPYLRAEKLTLEELKIDSDELDPGKVNITASAYRLIKNKDSFPTTPPFNSKSPQPLYHLVTNEDGESDTPLFLYQNALAQGKNVPCFYCNARKHKTTDCPSKKLDEFTHSIKKLGYLSLKQINDIFRNSLSGSDSPLVTDTQMNHPSSSESTLASYGFYDLKLHLQLRLLRNLWDSREENWNTVKTKRGEGEKGGYLWLAQDQLRTSNLREAGKMITTVLLKDPQGYRVQCLAGFLEIEKNQLNQAENYFVQALGFAKTKPQRLYMLFLLSRICELNRKPSRAEGYITKILSIYPQCTDARYQKAIFAFRNNQNKRALAELTNLIQDDGEYYIKALIDPELSPYSRVIHSRLKKLYQQARETALESIPKAEAEMKKLKDLIGDEEPPDDELESLWEKMNSMVNSKSYLGYIDIAHFARSIVYRCQGNIGSWKKKLHKVLHELESQCQKYIAYTLMYPYKIFSNSLHHQLIRLQNEKRKLRKVFEIEDLKHYKQALDQSMVISKNMHEIPLKIKKLESIKNTILYLSSFFKKSLFVQALNLLIGILLPPVVIHYLAITATGFSVVNKEVWFYQKLLIVAGGFLGVVLALILARNNKIGNQKQTPK